MKYLPIYSCPRRLMLHDMVPFTLIHLPILPHTTTTTHHHLPPPSHLYLYSPALQRDMFFLSFCKALLL